MLDLRRQPLKALYIVCKIFGTVVRMPYWALRYVFVGARPLPSWSWKRCMQVNITREGISLTSRTGFQLILPSPKSSVVSVGLGVKTIWVEATPHLVHGDLKSYVYACDVDYTRIPGYWYDKMGLDTKINAPPSPGEKVLLYFHGGSFIFGSAHPHDVHGPMIRDLVNSSSSFNRALALEYRLTSSHIDNFTNSFPAAIIDALAGYSHLITECGFSPENIVIGGDSAGGNLVLALTRYLVEARSLPEADRIPPPPGAILLISPWTDIGTSHKLSGETLRTHLATDFAPDPYRGYFAVVSSNYCGELGYPRAANSNPYLSPASVHPDMPPVSFVGFPKTIVIAGSAEYLVYPIRELVRRMKKDLGEKMVHYHEEKDAVHDYLGLGFWEPEARNTFARLETWLS